MIKFKNINFKKIAVIALVGITLMTTGCSTTKEVENTNTYTNVVQTIVEEEPITNKDEVLEEVINEKGSNVETMSAEEREAYILSYFEKAESKIDQILNSETTQNIKQESKEIFVNIVDFLFYEGEINGITYNELSDSTKVKVLDITSRIDSKIETKVPGYKDTIKDAAGKTYSYVSEKVIDGKEIIENKIIEQIGAEKYNEIINNTKSNYDDAKVYTKDLYTKGKDKLKKWYEGWK